MRFGTIRFPEMDRFPAERREDVLRRCISSNAMQMLRSRWEKYPALSAAFTGASLAVASDAFFHFPASITIIAVIAGVLVSFTGVLALRLAAEYRLIRHLLRDELRKSGG